MSFMQGVRIQTKTVQIDFQIALDASDPNELFLLQHLQQGVCYEPEVTHVLLRTVKPGAFVLDIGANIGFFTILMAKLVGPEGSVLAFECNPEVLKKLRANIEANDLKNVTICEQPLAEKVGPVKFWINSDSSGGSSLWDPGLCPVNPKSKATPRKMVLQATTLDDLIVSQGQQTPTVIKIDIEGAEPAVMRGAKKLLQNPTYPGAIISELNPFGMNQMGDSTEGYRDFMFDLGYELFLPNPNGTLPAMVPRNSEVAYQHGTVIQNGLFSTVSVVGEAWPKVPMDYD